MRCSSAILVLVVVLALPGLATAANITMSGSWSYNVSGSTVVLTADRIQNNSTSGISGTVKLELWALASPFSGGNFSGYRLATYTLGTLNGGAGISNISSGSIPFSNPPNGQWYFVLFITETTASTYFFDTYSNAASPVICVLGGPCGPANTNISLAGSWAFSLSGSSVVITADKVQNGASTGVSGTLRLELWAFPNAFSGQGKQVAVYSLGQLNARASLSSISSGSISLTSPPSGLSYFTLLITELNGSDYLADAFSSSKLPVVCSTATGCGSGNMTYHGGAVQHSQKIYTIFWNPSGTSFPNNYQTTINQFVQDLNGSSYYAIANQYGDSAGSVSSISLAGTWLDNSNALPTSPPATLSIANEAAKAISTNSWTIDDDSLFLVFTPSDISGDGTYCGYHSATTLSSRRFAFGLILLPQDQPKGTCLLFSSPWPNGQVVDSAISVTAHEMLETATDPFANSGWLLVNGTGEIGDLCANKAGPRDSSGADLQLNGRKYLVQMEWSNAVSDCAMSGTVSAAPVVSLSATSLDFGSQTTGLATSAKSIVITNTGNAGLTISSIGVSGTNSTDFVQTNNCGTSVSAAASCTINIVFTPGAPGSRSATLVITDNASGSPRNVALTGSGTAVTGPAVSLSASSLTFSSQTVGSSSAAQSVRLSNSGTASLSITAISLTGSNAGDFAQTNTCGSSVAAAGSCTINVTFNPVAAGTRTATLSIIDNAAGSPHTLSLSGTGASSSPAGVFTMYLPRQFQASEMSSVAVALVNPSGTSANVTFRLRSSAGSVLTTAQRTIAARTQFSIVLDQLFPGASAGWMSVDTDNYDVTGFWMNGNFTTTTDGAPFLRSSDAGPFPAFTFLLSASEISLVNTGSASASGTLDLYDVNGTSVASTPFQLPSLGLMQQTVASLFPGQASSFDNAGYSISVNSSSASAAIVGTTMTAASGSDNVVTNAVNLVNSTLVFPEVVDGTSGGTTYKTLLTISNPRSVGKNLTITLNPGRGSPLTVQRSIQPFGTLRFRVIDLFGISSVDGWISVTTDSDFVSGWATYTNLNTGGTTAVRGQSSTDTTMVFGHVADLAPWYTGIALVNNSTTNAQIEVYAMDPGGNLIAGPRQSASAAFTLTGGTKRAFLLSDLMSQTQTRSSDGGYVFIRSTNGVPIYGLQLFFQRNGLVYCNVPGTLMAGLPFTPPGASTSGPVTIQSVFTGDGSNVAKTSFHPGDTITLNMNFANTTGGPITMVRRYRAGSSTADPIVNFMSSGLLDASATSRFTSAVIPSTAAAGTYSFTGTVEYNGVQSSATASFTVGP
jgi:hypothetical protein